jgi:hypothetical protein
VKLGDGRLRTGRHGLAAVQGGAGDVPDNTFENLHVCTPMESGAWLRLTRLAEQFHHALGVMVGLAPQARGDRFQRTGQSSRLARTGGRHCCYAPRARTSPSAREASPGGESSGDDLESA